VSLFVLSPKATGRNVKTDKFTAELDFIYVHCVKCG
jgi:hypothetical protein